MKDFIKEQIRNSLIETNNLGEFIMYHGSSHDIKNFVDDFVGRKDATDQNGPGIYFTSSIKNAQGYGKNVYKVKITPRKSVSVKEGENASLKQIEWLILKAPDWKETAMNWSPNPNIGYKLAAKDFIEYNDSPHQQFLQVWYDFYRYNPVEYVRNMVKLGYDSIIINGMSSFIHDEDNITHIIVLNPNIIEYLGIVDN